MSLLACANAGIDLLQVIEPELSEESLLDQVVAWPQSARPRYRRHGTVVLHCQKGRHLSESEVRRLLRQTGRCRWAQYDLCRGNRVGAPERLIVLEHGRGRLLHTVLRGEIA